MFCQFHEFYKESLLNFKEYFTIKICQIDIINCFYEILPLFWLYSGFLKNKLNFFPKKIKLMVDFFPKKLNLWLIWK